MPRKRSTAEQIITKLREAEVELAKGQNTGQVCRKLAGSVGAVCVDRVELVVEVTGVV